MLEGPSAVLQTISAPVGLTVALLLVSLMALPAMRALSLTLVGVKALVQAIRRVFQVQATAGEPARPLRLDGLSSSLTRFAQQTRTLAIELRRCSGEAMVWPADSLADEPLRGWRESLLGDPAPVPLTELSRQVFEWLRIGETLPASERETLTACGVDLDAVRDALTAEGSRTAGEVVRALAGLLWQADERLAGAGGAGYRRSGAPGQVASAAPAAFTRDDDGDVDERVRRARWSSALLEHVPHVSRMAGGYARTSAEREDLEQDIALALWRALPTFRSESSLATFVHRVARYCCFRHLRRRKDPDDAVDPAAIADPGACIESAVLQADQRARIEEALTALPNNLESVLTMHLTGHSYAQIAEALGISERNVGVRLTRVRAHLRRQLVAA